MLAGMRERMVQLRVRQAPGVMGLRESEHRRRTPGVLEHRWTHPQTLAPTPASRNHRAGRRTGRGALNRVWWRETPQALFSGATGCSASRRVVVRVCDDRTEEV